MNNRVLKLIREREKNYIELTEQAIELFISELKPAIEKHLFNGKVIELYLNNVGILPQNFRFCVIEGKVSTDFIGDIVTLATGEEVEITLDNFSEVAESFTLVVPFSLLDDADEERFAEYFMKAKETDGMVDTAKIEKLTSSDGKGGEAPKTSEFTKVDKEFDETQKMAMKYIKNVSIH